LHFLANGNGANGTNGNGASKAHAHVARESLS
jgi:hypothetical protein